MAKNYKAVWIKTGDTLSMSLNVTNKNTPEALKQAVILDSAMKSSTMSKANIDLILSNYNNLIAVDISSWTISSSIRWCHKHIDNLTIQMTDPENGVFTLYAPPSQTILWVPRTYKCDIQFNVAGDITSSQTFDFIVQQDKTP